ncbi:MAG: HNH endonuclease signature motif containing protein [Mycobacteriaceae bacterium]|uniref:HNH endonuclease signature motif containing protein n=1 Tax=Corynebacterium sp. TaxID=1720 RepID=UPI003F9D70E1
MTTTTHPPQHTITDVQNLLNNGELVIISYLATLPDNARTSRALALRARTRTDAIKFAHAAELSLRMPELFTTLADTGTVTADHLDTIWGRINRQLTTVPAKAVEQVRADLDVTVADAITDWLATSPTPVPLPALRDRVDAAIIDLAPDLADDTADAEADSATLHRRGRNYILTVGSETSSAAIADALESKARARLAGLRRDRDLLDEHTTAELPGLPSPSQIKAQVLLELLGDTAETMHIRVNLYRASLDGIHGTGAGYLPSVGWIDTNSADRLESVADTVKQLPTDPADIPDAAGYRFSFTQQLYLDGRDGHCRFPSCTVPAAQCDNDHIVNSPHTDPTSNGPTAVTNGQKLCRAHHAGKTDKTWSCYTDDGGFTIHWTGPDGDTHTTHADGPLARFKAMSDRDVAELAGFTPSTPQPDPDPGG